MTDLEPVKADRVKGKDVHGKVMTLVRTQPKQLSLFQTFLPDNNDKYSNTIELYDAVPKYFRTRHMHDRRESGKYLPILNREFEHRGETYTLQIHPARIRYKDGKELEYSPVTAKSWWRMPCVKLPAIVLTASILTTGQGSSSRCTR